MVVYQNNVYAQLNRNLHVLKCVSFFGVCSDLENKEVSRETRQCFICNVLPIHIHEVMFLFPVSL